MLTTKDKLIRDNKLGLNVPSLHCPAGWGSNASCVKSE